MANATAPNIRVIICADCNTETARYDANDKADYERANQASYRHECKQQRAENRRVAKKAARAGAWI